MMEPRKHTLFSDPIHVIIALAALTLFGLSVWFAPERVIFTDTSVYLYTLADSGHFYIATNRFICIFSQLLPLAGVAAGLSLKAVLYLYSINCILIPLVCIFICLRVFRNTSVALAILLFYVLMSAWVFYYPVTEFQMGLCLLLLYHAFVTSYFQKEQQKPVLLLLVSLPLVVTIVFSHPLSLYVFVAWLIWLLLNDARSRKWILVFPLVIAIAAHFIKEHFFKAQLGAVSYDEQRKEGLVNFKAPVHTYFDSLLGKGALHALTGDYFICLLLVVLLTVLYVYKKQWLKAAYFCGITFAFWLLVTVTFRDWPYDHYPEHLYQPVPFFVALAFATTAPVIFPKRIMSVLCLVIFAVSFGKIYSNHRFFSDRLNWYRQYVRLMHANGIRNATLSAAYTVYGIQDSYWASNSESLLVSALPSPDSTVHLMVNGTAAKWNESWTGKSVSAAPRYFGKITERYVALDSLFTPAVLDSLRVLKK